MFALLVAVMQLQSAPVAPQAEVLAALQRGEPLAARRQLEAFAARPDADAPARARAWRQAGELAARAHDRRAADRCFRAATAAAPSSVDGRMAEVSSGELALLDRRWDAARRLIAPHTDDADPVVRAVARARLALLDARGPRLAKRAADIAIVATGVAWVARGLVRARRRRALLPRFGRALLATEGAALGGAALAPRVATFMASSGWMAFAIPAALTLALAWALREPAPRWRRWAAALLWTLWLAAGLHLALDVTWWSVESPLLVRAGRYTSSTASAVLTRSWRGA